MPTHYKGDVETARALNAFINLIRASDSLLARLTPLLEPYGLTAGQFGVLEALYHLGPLCQHALAEKLLRSGGNVTLVVDNLEKHGWVRRVRQEKDRRMVMIHLTPAGEKLIARVFPEHARALVREMSRLMPSEQESLRKICRKLGRGEGGDKGRLKMEAHHVASSPQ
ncbi:MAG TPA: MarR family transcriptional regulator [Verrucomicrobiae bacterium]|nr:MarR family transcriptional regulator [Verrucomicrobiae bacterium]